MCPCYTPLVRIVILSDVHGNLGALEAVLRHAQPQGSVDGVWCLGDTVGYGPQPRECIGRLREVGAVMVAGNHDRAGTGAMGTEEFNPDAASAARWTQQQLGEEERAYLDGLPEVRFASAGQAPQDEAAEGEFTLVHGSLRGPIWEYLYSYEAALAHLERQRTPFGLVGHTHVPMLVVEGEQFPQGCEMYYLEDGARVKVGAIRESPLQAGGARLVINPGGVGQPRDGDPRAAYGVYDTEEGSVTLHRVEYDIAATQRLMEAAGLPPWLIERLSLGR